MFIRINKTPNSPRKSIQIVESIRCGKKVTQKIIRYVGVAMDEAEEQKLKALAQDYMVKLRVEREQGLPPTRVMVRPVIKLTPTIKKTRGRPPRKRLEAVVSPTEVRLKEVEEEARIIEGVHDVAGVMFDELYEGLLKSQRSMKLLKDLVLTRLVYPASKHRSQQVLENQFGKRHSLDTIYRLMDSLFPRIEAIKQHTFRKTHALFPDKIDVLFFDVTTLYFESVEVDSLRNFGYSKDCRFNTTQVVLALATNEVGLPIGYELFEGNRAEVTTLTLAIESWKTSFEVGSVCWVGDRGMFTAKNVTFLEEQGYQYIIAAKLRKLPKSVQMPLFEALNYRPTQLNQSLAWVAEFPYQQARLIVSYKSARALKDQHDRQRVLDKIQKTLGKNKKGNPHRFITNAGVKKFVTQDEQATLKVDEAKISHDASWDGLHGIISNIQETSAETLLARYAQLWVIEESFRLNKHTLQIRPIFHWKPERIHSHIALCYMAFSVLRHLQYRVNLTQKLSVDTILNELLNVQASIHRHKHTNDRYRVPGYFTKQAQKIYKAFGLDRSLDACLYGG